VNENHVKGEAMVPPFRALLTVDAEGYSRNRDAELPGLHTEIRHAVERACERSGLCDTWRGARVVQSTGDGLFAVLPSEAMTALIYPFADRLQDALADSAPQLRASGLTLRLRVALHVGLVDDEHPVTAGISTATNDVSRLLDCEPVRAALSDSDPNVTFAAVIVSAEAFDMFVQGGHTGVHPSRFTQVRAQVKQFDRRAYLYVPVPSRRARDAGPRPDAESRESSAASSSGLSVSHVSVSGKSAQNIIGNQVGGSIRQRRS
jgi:hypothetical protein